MFDEETPNTPNGSKRANGYVHVAKLLKDFEKKHDSGKKILDESKIADESTDLYRDPEETEGESGEVGKLLREGEEDIDDGEGAGSGAREEYERALETAGYRMQEAWQDSMLGDNKTDNWLLSAYEKKGTTASSSDIETEPEGMQNGTAPLQSSLSAGKGSENFSDEQGRAQSDAKST